MSSVQQQYSYCAGVLPYTIFNNRIYFLLGKSKRGNRLTTFSGKNDTYDVDVCATAARECYEETLGCLMDQGDLTTRIRACNEESTLLSTTPRGMPCYTYVIEIPYKKFYGISFHKTRDFLQVMNIRSYALQEMLDIKWICGRSMFTKIRHQWEKHGTLSAQEEWLKLEVIAKFQHIEPTTWRRFDCVEDMSDSDIDK
jgi:hypothetical protein